MADPERSGTSGQHELPRCLRCESTSLNPTSSPDSVNFYECPRCDRRYTQKPGGVLSERWLGALSLVLYGVIFEKYPQQRAEFVASQLDHLDRLVSEIDLELNQPSQPVRALLDLPATEEDLREFLGLVAIELRKRQE